MEPGGPVRQPYAGVNFIPPVSDFEFDYTEISQKLIKMRLSKKGLTHSCPVNKKHKIYNVTDPFS
jgi:hypothetical protein